MTKHQSQIVNYLGDSLHQLLDHWDADGYDLITCTKIEEASSTIGEFSQHSYPARYLLIFKNRN